MGDVKINGRISYRDLVGILWAQVRGRKVTLVVDFDELLRELKLSVERELGSDHDHKSDKRRGT